MWKILYIFYVNMWVRNLCLSFQKRADEAENRASKLKVENNALRVCRCV